VKSRIPVGFWATRPLLVMEGAKGDPVNQRFRPCGQNDGSERREGDGIQQFGPLHLLRE
jgi:hypothetical protein